MPTVQELVTREEFTAAVIVRHGFTNYFRDYDILVRSHGNRIFDHLYRYQFVGCVEVRYELAMPPDIFRASLPDIFTQWLPEDDYPHPGYIWGTRFTEVFPGVTYMDTGERAAFWTAHLGRPMHEVLIGTVPFTLHLVFADFRVADLGPDDGNPALGEDDYPLPVTEPTSDGGVS